MHWSKEGWSKQQEYIYICRCFRGRLYSQVHHHYTSIHHLRGFSSQTHTNLRSELYMWPDRSSNGGGAYRENMQTPTEPQPFHTDVTSSTTTYMKAFTNISSSTGSQRAWLTDQRVWLTDWVCFFGRSASGVKLKFYQVLLTYLQLVFSNLPSSKASNRSHRDKGEWARLH